MPTPSTPSLARVFFDNIVTAPDPVAAIRGLITSDPPTFESDIFDCKLEPIEAKQRDAKHKELWSEVLGGYANAGGGVVIWGLDASKKREIDGRQIDVVCGERPIDNPLAVESRLRELQRQATDPPLAGVEIRSYTLSEDPARGFIICYVPEGPHKPYRSEHAGKHFYVRAGDNTPIMPRAVLASMFHPRSKAVFRAKAELQYTYATGASPARLLGRLGLRNVGTATARDVSIRVTWELLGTRGDMRAVGATPWSNRDDEFCFTSGVLFHPGIEFGVCVGNWLLDDNIPLKVAAPNQVPIWYIVLTLYIQDQMPQTIRVGFNAMELTLKEKLEVEASPEE
ncbi:MAG: ATP-binding protein [Gemmataceae bacterium]